MTCLQLFKRQKLAIIFHENTISLNEVIGYVAKLADFHDIWPDCSLTIEEQKRPRDFYIKDISLVTATTQKGQQIISCYNFMGL